MAPVPSDSSITCEACGRPPRSDGGPAIACTCPIVRTPDTLSGAWRLAGTRIFAMTLLSAWVDRDQDMERTLDYFAVSYPHLGEEDIREAIAWLHRYHELVTDRAAREWASRGLDDLAYGAATAKRFGISEDRFVELASDAARSAYRIATPVEPPFRPED